MRPATRLGGLILAAAGLIALAGCDSSGAGEPRTDASADSEVIDGPVADAPPSDTLPMDLPSPDAFRLDAPPPDLAPADIVRADVRPGCASQAECDDGVPCTEDSCSAGSCVHTPSAARCDDGIQCTSDVCSGGACRHEPVPARCMGGQTCDVTMGCRGGRVCAVNSDCADTDPCTVNERCDAATRVCRTDTLDGDRDGDPPRVCGGGDCDDSTPDVRPSAGETCNGRDDDCDGEVDEAPAAAACGVGFNCRAGACSCNTATPLRCSAFDATGHSVATCVDPQVDRLNCGACGRTCPGANCVAGNCVCSSGLTFCASGLAGACVDTRVDARNCGACGARCNGGTACIAGACACPAGTVLCGDTCVDTAASSLHCGACNRACPASSACASGQCRCSTGRALCGSRCVDLQTDTDHCGACGADCGDIGSGDAGVTHRACVGGACQCPRAGDVVCMNGIYTGCANLNTERLHCGQCGHQCPYRASCQTGTCVCDDPSLTPCGFDCVSLQSNTSHCGACGVVCGTARRCVLGACVG